MLGMKMLGMLSTRMESRKRRSWKNLKYTHTRVSALVHCKADTVYRLDESAGLNKHWPLRTPFCLNMEVLVYVWF